MEKEKINAEQLENVTGGNENKSFIYLVCGNCQKTFPAHYSGDVCDRCGSTDLHTVVKTY